MNDRNSLTPAPASAPVSLAVAPASLRGGVGARLRRERELRGMSIEEIGRATRIPLVSLEKLETDRFDDLPGEVFVRGFLRGYAKAVGLSPEEVLAWYGASRRVPLVAPIVPVSTHVAPKERRRVGIAVAFVLLLVLCTMALSFILRPRGRDVPSELSMGEHGQQSVVVVVG
ncbi:MAG: helix-turn-helix domain-containing protein [Myxococcales bacterium]|nr:helix-turn-helix domain-containing protein [Myxococcales bacterium]